MGRPARVLLIGGTSHVGKSTLAATLAERLGWQLLSTDQLARHPGRPWRSDAQALPEVVVQHYSTLATAELTAEVVRHYERNVWPIAEAIVRCRVANPYDDGLVLEGSAVLPQRVAEAGLERVSAIWLQAPGTEIEARIRASSGYAGREPHERQLIDAFLDRSLAFGALLATQVAALGLRSLSAAETGAIDGILQDLAGTDA